MLQTSPMSPQDHRRNLSVRDFRAARLCFKSGKFILQVTNTNTHPQSPTKRSPKPSRDIFTMPCSKRRNGRKEAKAPDGSVLHLSSERSLILKAHHAKIAIYA